jgi:hypothetical protein
MYFLFFLFSLLLRPITSNCRSICLHLGKGKGDWEIVIKETEMERGLYGRLFMGLEFIHLCLIKMCKRRKEERQWWVKGGTMCRRKNQRGERERKGCDKYKGNKHPTIFSSSETDVDWKGG